MKVLEIVESNPLIKEMLIDERQKVENKLISVLMIRNELNKNKLELVVESLNFLYRNAIEFTYLPLGNFMIIENAENLKFFIINNYSCLRHIRVKTKKSQSDYDYNLFI